MFKHLGLLLLVVASSANISATPSYHENCTIFDRYAFFDMVKSPQFNDAVLYCHRGETVINALNFQSISDLEHSERLLNYVVFLATHFVCSFFAYCHFESRPVEDDGDFVFAKNFESQIAYLDFNFGK